MLWRICCWCQLAPNHKLSPHDCLDSKLRQLLEGSNKIILKLGASAQNDLCSQLCSLARLERKDFLVTRLPQLKFKPWASEPAASNAKLHRAVWKKLSG